MQILRKKYWKKCLKENKWVTWCSPLVVQSKPENGKDKDDLVHHMIRASVDLRVPDKFVARHRKTRVTPLEVFEVQIYDYPVFFKLEMRQGYLNS